MKVRSWSTRSWRVSRRHSASMRKARITSTCSTKASSIRPRLFAQRCRTRLRSPACWSPPKPWLRNCRRKNRQCRRYPAAWAEWAAWITDAKQISHLPEKQRDAALGAASHSFCIAELVSKISWLSASCLSGQVASCYHLFSLFSGYFRNLAATPRDMLAAWNSGGSAGAFKLLSKHSPPMLLAHFVGDACSREPSLRRICRGPQLLKRFPGPLASL